MSKFAGFTLIELLVVVLIIAILSAVALPQYKRAVEKARFMQAVTAMRSLIDAEQVYYLANGSYLPSLDDLDISFPGNTLKDFSVLIHTYPTLHIEMLRNKRIDGESVWIASYLRDESRPYMACVIAASVPENSEARLLCKSLSGQTASEVTEPGYVGYRL